MSGRRTSEPEDGELLRITCELEVAPILQVARIHVLHAADPEHLGSFFVLRGDGENVAGRKLGAEVQLASEGVSRVHARFQVAGDVAWVEDAGSRNGTYVNGTRITRAVSLKPGDMVTLGQAQLRYALDTADSLDQLEHLRDAALRDHLTAAYNRRHFEERLSAELAFTVRHGTPLALLLFDLDRFKRVNDQFGHAGGDAVLKAFAAHLIRSVRTEDVVARWGGEEFAVLARGTDARGASALAERLRAGTANLRPTSGGQTLRFTTSVGVCAADGRSLALSPGQLVRFADLALYEAKRRGRDQVVEYAEVAALGTQPLRVRDSDRA